MTLSDAVTACVHEARSWLCHRIDGHVLWVLVARGRLWSLDRLQRAWLPFAPTVEQQASDGWHPSSRGPRTVKARRAA